MARYATRRGWATFPSHGPDASSVAPVDAIRMILVGDDPVTVFRQAILAGATQISPIAEGHGWRTGRLRDPFGYQWEVGKPMGE